MSVSQWTGTEHKEMEKMLLGITTGTVPSWFIQVIRSLLNFIYISQLQDHTSTTVKSLETCLKTFHIHKDIIIELNIRQQFNIPKVHTLITTWIASGCSDLQMAIIPRVLSNYTSSLRKKLTMLVTRGTMLSKWPSGFKGMKLCGFGNHTWYGWRDN